MSLPDTSELDAFANQLADASGQVIKGYFRRRFDIEHKADDSPVTEADRAAERALRELIGQRFPEHGIYGEEYGQAMGERYTWVLDPIDGTKSFINGMPTFGTLIALLDGELPILGIIDAPALNERWVAVPGQPTRYNGEACQIARQPSPSLSQASMLSTSIDMFQGAQREKYEALSQAVRVRRFGGDCYAYGLLALGFVDLVVEATMAPYDYLALAPVVTQAGGNISDWQGQPLGLNGEGTVVAAATAELHGAAVAVLKS